jgi:SAM-dependent methyltransferase
MAITGEGLDLDDPAFESRLQLMRGPADWWREDRDVQLRMIDRLGVRPSDRLLEIGCGPVQAGAALIRHLEPGCYTGVDISADRIAAARDVVAALGLADKSPRLIVSDDFGLDRLSPGSFDRIWCYQVVIHFPLPLVERFMTAVSTLLTDDGRAWFSARVNNAVEGFRISGKWLEFPVTEGSEDFWMASATAAGLSCRRLGTLGELGHPETRPGWKNPLFELTKA